jgi:hypothetical protein
MGCPEMSVTNWQPMTHDIPEEQRPNYNVAVAWNIALTNKKWMLWKTAYFVVRESYYSKAVMVKGNKH